MSGWAVTILLSTGIAIDFFVLLAVYSLRDFSRSRLDEICLQKGRRDRFGEILREDEDALLICEIVATALTALLAAFVASEFDLFALPADGWWGWTRYVGTLAGLFVLLLFAAVVLPWTIARVAGERYLFHTWPLIHLLKRAFQPLTAVLRHLDDLFHRLAGKPRSENGELASITDEIRTVVDEGQREGLLEKEARTMIHRVMELRDVDTDTIMTPRTDMFCIRDDVSLEEAREMLLEAGHSRVPVIGESPDKIKGLLYAKDLLRYVDHPENGRQVKLTDILRVPFYVPETTPIDKLLETMKRERVHLAIVVDEYGGTAGLVSMEDILEEIVGEIVDEYDAAEEPGIVSISPDQFEVHSRVHIDDLNEQFNLHLPEDDDYDTIGGFVFRQLGRIPAVGESFTWGKLRVTVKDADRRHIKKLRIDRDETLEPATADDV